MDLPPVGDVDVSHCVGFRKIDAGAAITHHLLARGRRSIVFGGAQLDERVMQHLYGWRKALEEAGCHDPALQWLNPVSSSLALGSDMFQQMLAAQPDLDAIFFCNDDLAQGALMAALRQSVAVPERVAVAGFNDLTGCDQMLPTLTTVCTPRAEIGHTAARLPLSLIRGEHEQPSLIDLGLELVVREST